MCEIVALIEVGVTPGSIVTPAVEPFQRIWAFEAKLLPVAVSGKSGEPAEMDVGEIILKTGSAGAAGAVVGHALKRFAAFIEPSPVARS